MADKNDLANQLQAPATTEVKPVVSDTDIDFDDYEEERLADVLNSRGVQKAISVWQDATKRQAENQRLVIEHRSALEKQRFELLKQSHKWLRWVVAFLLFGIALAFIYYRETPDVAMKIVSYVVGVFGALGVGYGARPRRN